MNKFILKQLASVESIFNRWMQKHETEIVIPDNIEIISNIPYIADSNPCHMLDIYRPVNIPKNLPVIINLHGGGLLFCTKEVNRPFCIELAKRGFLVFCIDYPLVPNANVCQILSDVSVGINFLSLYIAAVQKNSAIAHAANFTVPALPIKALGLISGMFYTTKMDSIGLFLKKDFYGENYKKHPFYRYVSPDCPEVTGNLPPSFLVTSKSDNLHSHTMSFIKGLKSNGGTWKLLDFPLSKGLQHDFVIIAPESAASQQAIDEMVEFFTNYN